ncbi:MAG: hypothetical protein AUH76_05865 [Candidatus Rokubacteria bacterium 13_1_40CM_4_67_11]|nr:MAG: hypothetical protein AUH76_05865 [Candidatus Rokubacteria bacterium 13_1_40CM_4_67_11]OLD31355.1 MAG: hypothetical protein AUI49_06525 [Candidatus Rokubacteria bacterium 13_1_40CM_2_68_13]
MIGLVMTTVVPQAVNAQEGKVTVPPMGAASTARWTSIGEQLATVCGRARPALVTETKPRMETSTASAALMRRRSFFIRKRYETSG